MRIRTGTLRKLLREVAISPSLFANNKPQQDPVEKKGVAEAMQALEHSFKSGLVTNLVLASASKYNKETREFDDAAYKAIDEAASAVTEKMIAQVNSAVKSAWQAAHQQVGGEKKKVAA